MRRLLISAVAIAASALPLISTRTEAGGLKLRKPDKIDPAVMVVDGGWVYPVGLDCGGNTECIDDHGFGHLRISFPTPVDKGNHVDYFRAVCTPRYAVTPASTDFPTASIARTFGPTTDTYADTAELRAQSYRKNGDKISLMMPKYEDPATSAGGAQYPPLSCAITLIMVRPGANPDSEFVYIVESRAPKLTTSPSSDCATIGGGYSGFPSSPAVVEPTSEPGKTHLHLSVVVNSGAGIRFQHCFVDASYRAYFNTSQEVTVSAQTTTKRGRATLANGVEVVPSRRTASVKRLSLTAPVMSSIPLLIQGSRIVYRFDASKLQVAGGNAGCVTKAARTAGKANTCIIDNVAGRITLNSTDVALAKVGKMITSAQTTLNFTYVNDALHPETTSAITLESVQFQVYVNTRSVTLVLETAGIQYGVADPNIGAPAVTFTGLT
jgi:hypothetical protein